MLNQVGNRKDIPQAHVIVLGDKGCGKRTLIKQMNKPFIKFLPKHKIEEYGSDFANFDCSFLFYKDIMEGSNIAFEDANAHTRINVWLISEPEMGKMLTKILKPSDLEHTFAVIMPDLEQPWDIKN